MKSLGVTRPGWIAYLIAAVVIVLDQLTKAYVLYVVRLPDARHIDLSPVLDLTMVWNRGVSFGLFRSPDGQEFIRWALALFSTAVAVGLVLWLVERWRGTSASCGVALPPADGEAVEPLARLDGQLKTVPTKRSKPS